MSAPLRVAAALLGLAGLAATAACATAGTPTAGASTARPTAASPSPSTNTGVVCATINTDVATDLVAFGTDLGNFAGHLSGRNNAAAGKAKASALTHLGALAGKIRSTGGQASAAELGTAADAAAGNLDRLAADPALLAGVHGPADVPPVIQRVTLATDPLVNACA